MAKAHSETRGLAMLVAEFGAKSMPAEVLDRTHTLVLDGSGALLAAANPAYSTGRLIAEFARDQGGREESGVVGHGFKTGAAHAALANGTMGYACDVEPHHPAAILHPIAVTLPTALAMAERTGAGGTEFLTSIALGCEVEYRVSMALGPAELYALGFHPSAVCGTFGAAAVAAYLLGLDAEATERAFGLAACQTGGLMAWESDPTENSRPFQMGMAARNGVTAALLAEAGFGGPAGVFDRHHSPLAAFSRAPTPQRLTHGIGETWDGIMELAIKPYACCAFIHPALDVVLGLMREEGVKADEVEYLTMHFPKSGAHCINGNPLKSHCAQYILAVTMARGELQVADIFVDARVGDPAVRALEEKIHFNEDEGELEDLFPEFYATKIELMTTGGEYHQVRNDVARGYPETPLGKDEIEAKFEALVSTVASSGRKDELREVIRGLPQSNDISAYARLMTAEAGT